MKILILVITIIGSSFLTASAQGLDETLLKIQKLHTVLVQNESKLSTSQLTQINVLLNQAQVIAQSGSSGSDYTDCRNAGYSHDACTGQDGGYVDCRKNGYSHDACSMQPYGYTECRKAGYSHEACSGQNSGYTDCRKNGYSHEACSGQPAAYSECRKAGHSHESCKGQNIIN